MKFPQLPEPLRVEFPDKERALVLDNQATITAERKLAELRKQPMRALMVTVEGEWTASGVFTTELAAVILWVGMLKDEPEITFEQALSLITNPMVAQAAALSLVDRFFQHKGLIDPAEGADTRRPLDEKAATESLNGSSSGHSRGLVSG